MTDAPRIRSGRPSDVARLQEIELSAGQRFAGVADLQRHVGEVTEAQALRAAATAGLLWVAVTSSGRVVGFVFASRDVDALHVEELSVHLDFGRRGIGGALMAAVERSAQDLGCASVSLTTYRDVPWNAPYYAKLGYRTIEAVALRPHQRELVQREDAAGLDAERRVFMKKEIDDSLLPESRNDR